MELPRICEAPLQTEAKGVCFFDVDGTLTQGEFGKSRVRPPVEACIAAGWDVGVATASTRKWDDVCERDGGSYRAKGRGIAGGWMTDAMCANLAKNDFVAFNSSLAMLGGKEFKDIAKVRGSPGAKKAMFIGAVMEQCFPGLPAVLFDNDPNWDREARGYKGADSDQGSTIKGVAHLPRVGVAAAYCMASVKNAASCGEGDHITSDDWQSGNIARLLETKAAL